MYTPAEAIEAIQARISGEWDNDQLVKLGALLPDTLEDIGRIVAETHIEPAVSVLFLKEIFPEGILAVFPDQIEKNQPIPMLTCYSPQGQHSVTSKGYAMMLKEATLKEYKRLLTELTQQGYNLNVLNDTGYKF